MYNSKLIQSILVLDSQEREAFKKWAQSPAINQHTDVEKLLLNLLSKRKLTKRTTQKEKIFKHLYPSKNYDDLKLRHLMNMAIHIFEKFVYFSSQKKDIFTEKKALISFYQARKLDKYAQQYIHKATKVLELATTQNHKYYTQQYHLEQAIFERQGTSTRSQHNNLQAVFDNHYIAFVLDTLRHACTAITHQNLYKLDYDIPLLKPILQDIEQGKHEKIPAIQLYYYSYMTLKKPEQESYFEQLKKLLTSHAKTLPPKEIKSIYIITINYCVRRLNTGLEKYVRAVFELYQYGLEHQILVENGMLGKFTYKNIITAAIRLKEYKWVETFMQQYTSFLELPFQLNYSSYAKAKLFFAQGNFDATLQLLTQIEFDDLFLNMDAKLMLLKIYYERQYFDSLDALITSFRRFLQRKETLAYLKPIYENIINLTEKLIKLTPDKASKLALQEEIENTNPLTERPWLLTQLHKLK
ncbi:MAG: hypothetical protein GY810_30565 [Aureispira sp.]|nr:hypothetical protein [Aureispira sp.]